MDGRGSETDASAAAHAIAFDQLPSEVIQQILYHVPPISLCAIQRTSKRLNTLARERLLWRFHCRTQFIRWRPERNISQKFALPVAEVDWQDLFDERWSTNRRIRRLLDMVIGSQQRRVEWIGSISHAGYDAKDVLLEQIGTGAEVEDCLARRWWSEAALGLIHRRMAIETWLKVANGEESVTLEQALGAFDVFTLGTRKGDFDDITEKLDSLAAKLRAEQSDIDELPTRRKALALVSFLRANGYTGIEDEEEHYHDIQNNFIGYALHDDRHQTLPLILAAIYICLARRFGVDAYASNVPMHIFGLVKAPVGKTLDGDDAAPGSEREQMFIDPFHSSEEVPVSDVRSHLLRLGVTDSQFEEYTTVASLQDLVVRTTRNIMTSAQTSRERDLAHGHAGGSIGPSWALYTPPLDESFYGALWALLIVQTMQMDVATPLRAAHLAARRARMLPLLLENMQTNCPWDVCLLEEFVLPMFMHSSDTTMWGNAPFLNQRDVRQISADKEQLVDMLHSIRTEDRLRKPPQYRPPPPPTEEELQQQRDDPRSWGGRLGQQIWWDAGPTEPEKVKYRVGSLFRHKRYGYEGVIVGWDPKCVKDEGWISQMGVNRLPGGRDQSFYHVL